MTTNNPRCPWEHLSSSLTSAWRESLGARQAVLPETRLSDAERAVQVGDAEGQVQGLTAVEPGIACSLVLVTQVGLGDVLAAADALGDVVAGELDVDACAGPVRWVALLPCMSRYEGYSGGCVEVQSDRRAAIQHIAGRGLRDD
jgi:hypothetical protein